MTGLILAIGFLTRLPVPRVSAGAAAFSRSIRWFPAVGFVIGGFVAGAGRAGALIDGWVAALAALAMWVTITGALHLDGLADLADARGAAHGDRARLRAVLADPHVGSFGVVSIVLQILAKLILLHAVLATAYWPAIALIPFAARIGPLVWTVGLPPLHDGLAARFRTAVGIRTAAAWIAVLLAVAWVSPPMLAVLVLIPAWGRYLRRSFGGISGDGHGAGIELVETGLLIALLGWSRA